MAGDYELVGYSLIVEGLSKFIADSEAVVAKVGQVVSSITRLGDVDAFKSFDAAATAAFGAIATGAVAAVAGLALVEGASTAFAANFNQQILNAGAAVGATNDQLKQLATTTIDVGRKSTASLNELAQADNTLVRSGVSLTDTMHGTLNAVSQLSQASGGTLDLERSALLVASAMDAFNLHAAQTGQIVNAAQAVVSNSTLTFDSYASAIKAIGPLAQSLGFSLQDVSAALGEMTRAGATGTQSMNGLQQLFIHLANPSKQVLAIMKEYGISLNDAAGRALPLRNIIAELSRAFSDNAVAAGTLSKTQQEQALSLLSGVRSLRDLLPLINAGTEGFDAMSAAINNTDVNNIADRLRGGLIPQLDVLRNNIEALAIAFGTPFANALANSVKNVNDFLASLDTTKVQNFAVALQQISAGNIGVGAAGIANLFGTDLKTQLQDLINSFNSVSIAARQAAAAILLIGSAVVVGPIIVEITTVALGLATTLGGLVVTALANFAAAIFYGIVAGTGFVAMSISIVSGFAGMAAAAVKAVAGFALFAVEGVGSAVIALTKFAFTTLLQAAGALGAFVTETLPAAIVGFIKFAIAGVGAAIAALITFATVTVPAAIVSLSNFVLVTLPIATAVLIRFAVVGVGSAIAALVVFATVTIPQAANSLKILVTTVLPAAIEAFLLFAVTGVFSAIRALAAFIVAAAPVIIGIAAIAGAAFLVYKAWESNFGGIQGVTKVVFDAVAKAISDFINWLKTVPIIGSIVEGVATAFSAVSDTVGHFTTDARGAIEGLVSQVQQGFPAITQALNGLLPGLGDLDNQFALLQAQSVPVSDANSRMASTAGQAAKANTDLGNTYPSLAGGAQKATVSHAKLAQEIARMIADLPGASRALADYLATLEEQTPGRLGAMVAALEQSKQLLADMAVGMVALLTVEDKIKTVQQEINTLTAANNLLDLQQTVAIAAATQQIDELKIQELQIDAQELPIKQQIAAIDTQISQLQRTNYALQGQILALTAQELPIKQQIAAIDTQIQQVSADNYNLQTQIAQLDVQALPLKQAILDLEQQITDQVNLRTNALNEQNVAQAQLATDTLQQQIDILKLQEQQAFASGNYAAAIGPEQKLFGLEQQLELAKANLTVQKDQKTVTDDQNAAYAAAIKVQEAALQQQLQPITDATKALQDQLDTQKALNTVVVDNLNKQKAALEAVLVPLEKQRTTLQAQLDLQKAQNDIVINGLEAQKAALQDLLTPLEAQKANLQAQIDLLTAHVDQIKAQITLQKDQNDAKIAQDKLQLTSLQTIEAEEKIRYAALINDFLDLVTKSDAFTADEAANVIKRLSYWSSEQDAILTTAAQIKAAKDQVDNLTQALKDMTSHDWVVTIKYNTVGSPAGLPKFAEGGTVPGPFGSPQLVIAHGGEQFLGIGNSAPTAVSTAQLTGQSGIGGGGGVTQYNTTYQVNPTYVQPQDPGSIAMDLRAIIAMTRH